MTIVVVGWLAASRAAAAAPLPPDDPLAKIGHIFVVFEENRSFDNMFGLFPGADGLSNAGEAARQVDDEGLSSKRVYERLPPVMNTAVRPVRTRPALSFEPSKCAVRHRRLCPGERAHR